MRQTVDVAITIDDNYAQHACVMLQSLLLSTSGIIYVYCVHQALGEHNISVLRKHFKRTRLKLKFISFNEENVPALPLKTGDHLTATAYYRIWLPLLLPHLSDVLFLDSDLIIRADIRCLAHLDVSNVPLAAVEEPGMNDAKKAVLNIPSSRKYFNSGVMKMNLDYFRKFNLSEKVAEFIARFPEKCEFWDQDALNAVVKGNFLALDFKFNQQWVFFEDRFSSDERFREAVTDPLIVHYTGGGHCKPWFYNNRHPYKKLYYDYLQRTPYKKYLPPDLPPADRWTKILRIVDRWYKVI